MNVALHSSKSVWYISTELINVGGNLLIFASVFYQRYQLLKIKESQYEGILVEYTDPLTTCWLSVLLIQLQLFFANYFSSHFLSCPFIIEQYSIGYVEACLFLLCKSRLGY